MSDDLYQRVLAELANYNPASRGQDAKGIAEALSRREPHHPGKPDTAGMLPGVRRVLKTLLAEGRVSRRVMSGTGAYHWTLIRDNPLQDQDQRRGERS
jgi:hypothetical protein